MGVGVGVGMGGGVGCAVFCASAESGYAAAPARTVMKSRRLMHGLRSGSRPTLCFDMPTSDSRMNGGFTANPGGLPKVGLGSLDFPLGLEGLLTNPGTPGGKDGGEANPTELHEGVQG